MLCFIISPSSLLSVFLTEPKLSVAPEMDIMDYCKKEWRGNTQKATCMKKGYEEVSQKFTSIRRVRGDNYCALRATLFQAMSQPAVLPSWLQDPELTLVRCCCRFASAMFPVVLVRKTSLCCLCSVLELSAVWRQHVGSLGFVWLRWFCIVKRPKYYFPEEKNDKIYLNSWAELESECLEFVKNT